MYTTGSYLFHEEQRFRESPVLFLVLAACLFAIGVQVTGMYKQLFLHQPWGDQPMPDTALILISVGIILLMIFLIVLFLKLTLITEVRREGFYFSFPFLINKTREIRKVDIDRFEVGSYHPIRDFGGYGIRRRAFGKKAYNVKGRQGVKFYLKNGKLVLFGTQKPEELRRALDKMMNPSIL